MNEQQKQIYDSLNQVGKNWFDESASKYSHWSINQRLAKAKIECLLDKPNVRGKSVLEIIKETLEGFNSWCEKNLPDTFIIIKDVLVDAIRATAEAIRTGFIWVINKSEALWNKFLAFFS